MKKVLKELKKGFIIRIAGFIGQKKLRQLTGSKFLFIDDISAGTRDRPKEFHCSGFDKNFFYHNLEFDLEDNTDMKIAKAEWILTGPFGKKNTKRFGFSSLYDYILDYANYSDTPIYSIKTDERGKVDTVNIFMAQTSNFAINSSCISHSRTPDIRNKDLPTLGSFVKEILDSKPRRKIVVKLTGYADSEGGNTTPGIRLKNNIKYSKQRAENVGKWLNKTLKHYKGRYKILSDGCHHKHYKLSNNRCVEIKIFCVPDFSKLDVQLRAQNKLNRR